MTKNGMLKTRSKYIPQGKNDVECSEDKSEYFISHIY